MESQTFSREALLHFLAHRCAPRGVDACMQETEKQLLHALIEDLAATLENGTQDERATLAAALRSRHPVLSVPVPHTVGIWFSRYVEQRIHPSATTEEGRLPMVGFMIRAWCGEQPNEPSNDEWTRYVPLAMVDLADWMAPDTRWWRIWKAAHDAVVALDLPFYLWPESAHGHVAAEIVERPDIRPRMITQTQLVPVLASDANNHLRYVVGTVTTTKRAA
ncbi:MAG: hypothetical protein M3R24_14345 [Chloroflexota bacterium]|nr:hypothetical protein [Chloroflexota bacterium]